MEHGLCGRDDGVEKDHLTGPENILGQFITRVILVMVDSFYRTRRKTD